MTDIQRIILEFLAKHSHDNLSQRFIEQGARLRQIKPDLEALLANGLVRRDTVTTPQTPRWQITREGSDRVWGL